jgi:hypothetical protein
VGNDGRWDLHPVADRWAVRGGTASPGIAETYRDSSFFFADVNPAAGSLDSVTDLTTPPSTAFTYPSAANLDRESPFSSDHVTYFLKGPLYTGDSHLVPADGSNPAEANAPVVVSSPPPEHPIQDLGRTPIFPADRIVPDFRAVHDAQFADAGPLGHFEQVFHGKRCVLGNIAAILTLLGNIDYRQREFVTMLCIIYQVSAAIGAERRLFRRTCICGKTIRTLLAESYCPGRTGTPPRWWVLTLGEGKFATRPKPESPTRTTGRTT